MASARVLQKVLHRYARHVGGPHFSMENLEEYIPKFVRRYSSEYPMLGLLVGEEGAHVLQTSLEQLEQTGMLQLHRANTDGSISGIYYNAFYSVEIQRWYGRMADDRSLPFPDENALEHAIPAEVMTTVDVANNLMHWIESDREDPGQVLVLRFPDGIESMLTTVRVLREQTLPLVLNKIREYLRTDNNASFMETKLRAAFPTKEIQVRDELQTAQTRPDDTLKTIVEPTDFQFHFWTQLSSMIIKEYAKKNEKLDQEHGFCQAAYLLGYYAVFLKGRAQLNHQREEGRKLLRTGLQKPPFIFGIQDLYKLADDRGVPLDKKVPTTEINAWVEDMLKRPSEREVSDLVTFDTPTQKGLLIHSAQYIPLLLRQRKAAGPVLKRELTNKMVADLSDDLKEEWILDDAVFEAILTERVREEFPLLFGLATFHTLFLVMDGQELPAEQKSAVSTMLDLGNKTTQPWSRILEIERREIYKDARLQLPVWMIIPVFRIFVRLLRSMFSSDNVGRTRGAVRNRANGPAAARPNGALKTGNQNGQDGQRSSAGTAAAREKKRKQFRDALLKMQQSYLTPDQTADQRLKQLRKNWNPLIDPTANENLVEDVNSLCRDCLRRMRSLKTLQVPDHDRIREEARRIAANKAFDRIQRRTDFEAYLELYMITVMQRSDRL